MPVSGYTTPDSPTTGATISSAHEDVQSADLIALYTAIGADETTAATLATTVAAKAPLASPAFTGNPTAPTPTAGDNDTSIATTAFVTTAVSGVSGGGAVSSVAGRTGAVVLAESDVTNLTTDLAAKAPAVGANTPEFYGVGYGGAASDDWGPAINAAIVAANTAHKNVELLANTYGIRTTIVWPAGANNVSLIGKGRGTILQKLADVVVVNNSGTSSTRRYDCRLQTLKIDGGSNTAWTATLLQMDYTSRCHTDGCWWSNNYGSAITGVQAWDSYHTKGDVFSCGGTNGTTPAILFSATDADAGAGSNNQWFDEFTIETWRSGALWFVGTAAAPISLIKLGRMKIERVVAGSGYGPAVRFGYVTDVDWSILQISTGGSLASGLSQGYVAWMHVYGTSDFRGGALSGYIGAVAAGDVDSMIHFDGATATNNGIRLANVSLEAGSGSGTAKPSAVFRWSGTNNAVHRGPISWDSNYWSVPTDVSGTAPTSLITSTGIPVTTAATDAALATAIYRTAVDGDELWFSSQEWRRQGGVWLPKFRSDAYVRNGTNAATLRMSIADPLAAPDAIVPTITGIYFTHVPAVTGDVLTKIELPINAAYTLGTSGYGYWLALYAGNGPGPTSMTLLAWTGELSSASLSVAGGPESRSIVQDASNNTITSYTVPSGYDGLIYAAFYLNPGTGGTTGSLNGVAGKFNIASAAFTGMHKRAMTVTAGTPAPPPTTQAVSGAYANVPLIAVR